MRFASRWSFGLALLLLSSSSSPRSETLSAVHQQRYCMGTMFDIVAYHASRPDAEQAVEKAMQEIVRLDQVMSDFKADSDLSKLNREASHGFVAVEPSLYDVIQESIAVSRRSGGTFDVTIAPLLKAWKQARSDGRRPTAAEIAAARRCVGYENIETSAPNRIRFHSDCLEIDLGGIGKGYAVERGIAVLRSAGIRDAVINGGGSSIASIGAPPGRQGWPVQLGAKVSGVSTLLLRDASISTSQQNLASLPFAPGNFGEILDPHTGAPAEGGTAVSVVAPSATLSDALSTTLLMLSMDDASKLLAQFGGVSAIWVSAAGELKGAYRESRLLLSDAR
jgi:thiamine biosynthesis lipoprotein